MSRKEPEDQLLHVDYDGIQEYDNPLPRWWNALFIITIVFAVGYLAVYHLGGPGLSEREHYQKDQAALTARLAKQMAAAGKVDEPTLARLAATPVQMEKARALFVKHCVSCHAAQGQGNIGPNLTDDYQLHGTGRVDIYNTIRDGVPTKGMQSWVKVLRPEEMMSVAAYVATLRGTNVQGKAPQGQKVGPFP